MSNSSQPRWPVLMHSPMWLNASSFFNRIMLFIRLSLICGENLATRAQSVHSSWFPLTPLQLPTASGPSAVQPLSNAYKNQITQFQDMYDHCNSQTTWSDHKIFDLTLSHFDSYCFLISHNHDWSPQCSCPLWHHTYAPACHGIPLVSPKCSNDSNDGKESGALTSPNTFLWNHTTFMMKHLMHLLKCWIWQWAAK
jgi:hypothetical protein